jgi:hypothetical protein
VAAAACDSPNDVVVENDGVQVTLDQAGLIVRNDRTTTIYTFAVDRETATVITWAPCSDPNICGGVRSGQRVRVPADRISGWVGSDEILLYWWHLVPRTGGGFAPESIRSIIVPFQQ